MVSPLCELIHTMYHSPIQSPPPSLLRQIFLKNSHYKWICSVICAIFLFTCICAFLNLAFTSLFNAIVYYVHYSSTTGVNYTCNIRSVEIRRYPGCRVAERRRIERLQDGVLGLAGMGRSMQAIDDCWMVVSQVNVTSRFELSPHNGLLQYELGTTVLKSEESAQRIYDANKHLVYELPRDCWRLKEKAQPSGAEYILERASLAQVIVQSTISFVVFLLLGWMLLGMVFSCVGFIYLAVKEHRTHQRLRQTLPHLHPRSTWLAYVLWGTFGSHGLHLFYTNRTTQGLIYLVTCGICGLGQCIDCLFVPFYVSEYNEEATRLAQPVEELDLDDQHDLQRIFQHIDSSIGQHDDAAAEQMKDSPEKIVKTA